MLMGKYEKLVHPVGADREHAHGSHMYLAPSAPYPACTSKSLQALQVCLEMLKFASWLAEAETVCRNKDLSSLADRSPVSLPVLDACHAWQLPQLPPALKALFLMLDCRQM